MMIMRDRLLELREQKKFSQGEIEERTGLVRCYISRVENGHTVPAVEMLEKFAHALELPMYQLFYDDEEPPKLQHLPKRKSVDEIACGYTTFSRQFTFSNPSREHLCNHLVLAGVSRR